MDGGNNGAIHKKNKLIQYMKYAFVTGGSSGIGLGVAKMLLSKGYYVFVSNSLKLNQNCTIFNRRN